MPHETTTIKARPLPLLKWWQRTRPRKRGIQLNTDLPPCVEFYVPWWGWPLELTHRAIFGTPKLTAIEAPINHSPS